MPIRWPDRYAPGRVVAEVSNEIAIAAPPEAVWACLIRAADWPNWYPNSQAVKIDGGGPDLFPGAQFSWRTFGVNVRSTVQEMMRSEFVQYARALGLSPLMQVRYALRNSMTAMVTVIGIMFWFMLGGAVLVETVFSWDGLGQYAVESVVNSDYAPLQAFVLIAAVFTMLVFLLVDLAYFLIDPRIKG